jgi:hypothetical protein
MENAETVSGIERAVFGERDRGEINRWLAAHVAARLDDQVAQVLFRSGRRDEDSAAPRTRRYLAAAVTCQRRLADAGSGAPTRSACSWPWWGWSRA